VRVVDRAVHPVAEAELLGQAHRHVAEGVAVAARADLLDQRRVVLRVAERLDLGLEAEAPAEIRLLHLVLRAGVASWVEVNQRRGERRRIRPWCPGYTPPPRTRLGPESHARPPAPALPARPDHRGRAPRADRTGDRAVAHARARGRDGLRGGRPRPLAGDARAGATAVRRGGRAGAGRGGAGRPGGPAGWGVPPGAGGAHRPGRPRTPGTDHAALDSARNAPLAGAAGGRRRTARERAGRRLAV